jgi:hypothetical protein
LDADERLSIEASCASTKYTSGTAAYDRCLQEKLEAWSHGEKVPDLSALSPDESQSIKAACSTPKIMSGPAAYDHCLHEQIKALTRPDRGIDKDRRAISPPPSGDSESKRKSAPWLIWFLEAGGTALLVGLRERKRRCVGCHVVADSAGSLCTSCLNKQNETSRAARERAERKDWQRCQQAEAARQRREAEDRSHGEKETLRGEREERERREPLRTIEGLEKLTGSEFEGLIESLFRDDGYEVQRGGRSGDEGIDLVIKMSTFTDVVQCRRSRSNIGYPAVRDFYGEMMHADVRHRFIVTTADFSTNARAFAIGKPISLISGQDLVRWIGRAYSARAQAENAGAGKWEFGFCSSADPFSILGIPRGASPVEIRNAYHREISKYHPDKVAHLGDELQQVAKQRTQTINQAYADIRKGF